MNPAFADAMQAELASIAREAPVPAPPLGYGTDLSCITDCTHDYAETDPQSTHGLAEYLLRMLTTPRGTIIDAPDLGIDTRAWCNVHIGPDTLATYSDQVRGECKKDDRVDDATCAASFEPMTSTLTLSVTITAIDPNIGEFTFTFAVAPSGEVLLQSIV